MDEIDIESLLERLKGIGIVVKEQDAEVGRELVLECTLPFPFQRQHTWYPLILDKDQTTVKRVEVKAILRHLWYVSEEAKFFPDADDDLELDEEPAE